MLVSNCLFRMGDALQLANKSWRFMSEVYIYRVSGFDFFFAFGFRCLAGGGFVRPSEYMTHKSKIMAEDVASEVEAIEAVYGGFCVVLNNYPPHFLIHIKPRTAGVSSERDISIGGTDGSANTINWAMAEMIKNPSILKRAQQEVRKFFGNQANINEEEMDELRYVKSVIKETLRLHPPAPLLVPRENNEIAQINEYHIPAKSKVLINVWAINRDPRYWEEAESFKPERFLESLVDYKGTDFQYLTFGAGRRMCPGNAYGWANVVLPLVELLYYFDWRLPTGMKT